MRAGTSLIDATTIGNAKSVFRNEIRRTAVALMALGMILPVNIFAQTPAAAPPKASSVARQASQAPNPSRSELKTREERDSYAVGADIGRSVSKSLRGNDIDVDPIAVLRGFTDGFRGEKVALSDDDIKAILSQLQKEVKARAEGRSKGEVFVTALKLPATYVNAQAPGDKLLLNADSSFLLQEGGELYHGNFVSNGKTLELNISETSTRTTVSRQGNNLTDSIGQTWRLQ
jgi:hypothetical protein